MSEDNKYKICPTCGAHNDPRTMECEACGADLIGVGVTDVPEGDIKDDDTKDGEKEQAFFRVCSCGHMNMPQLRKCESCGEDISHIVPVQVCSEPENCQTGYRMDEINGRLQFLLPVGSVIIGREQELKEFLGSKSYVSRTHAEIENSMEGLFIRNLSRTNYTYVNNVRITDERKALHDGDEIGLGGNSANGSRQDQAAYFIIRKV